MVRNGKHATVHKGKAVYQGMDMLPTSRINTPYLAENNIIATLGV